VRLSAHPSHNEIAEMDIFGGMRVPPLITIVQAIPLSDGRHSTILFQKRKNQTHN
jgi:hypothetical protein